MYNQDVNFIDKPEVERLDIYIESGNVDFSTAAEVYNAVYENAFHPMYMGFGNGHIFKFNKKFADILGYSEKELKGKEGFEIFDTEEKVFVDLLNERNLKGIAKADVTCMKKSGERFPCHISSVLYKTNQGERRSLNTIIDLSDTMDDRSLIEDFATTDI